MIGVRIKFDKPKTWRVVFVECNPFTDESDSEKLNKYEGLVFSSLSLATNYFEKELNLKLISLYNPMFHFYEALYK